MNRHLIIAAGGTGGHMIPAHATALALTRLGFEISLVTDARGAKFTSLFPKMPKHVIAAESPGRSGIAGMIKTARAIWDGRAAARRLYQSYQPAAVIGFGGYPSLPALWAATSLNIPIVLHEQNAVLGRSNRLFASRAAMIATSFNATSRISDKVEDRVIITGNPVREDILALRDLPFPDFHAESLFRVLVIGGSQGASILSDVVPTGLEMLPTNLRRRLQVTQQCRDEDIKRVRAMYDRNGIPAELSTYLDDLPDHLRWTHLVIARAGASTLSELTAAGRPAILIPLPGATDDHQTRNCRDLVKAGGARLIAQDKFTPTQLVKQIQRIALEPGALVNAARRAHKLGQPRAADDLAEAIKAMLEVGPQAAIGRFRSAHVEPDPIIAPTRVAGEQA